MAKKAVPATKAPTPTRSAVKGGRAKAAAASPPPPAKPTKAPVITLKQLAAQFGESHDIPLKQAQAMLDGMVGLLVEHLKAGDKLRLNGLGVLEIKDRPARTARNPATGATVQVAASRKIAFRPAAELKKAI